MWDEVCDLQREAKRSGGESLLENAWWEVTGEASQVQAHGRTNEVALKRDYYFAVSSEGQCLWIYQDLTSHEYFLHGYFD